MAAKTTIRAAVAASVFVFGTAFGCLALVAGIVHGSFYMVISSLGSIAIGIAAHKHARTPNELPDPVKLSTDLNESPSDSTVKVMPSEPVQILKAEKLPPPPPISLPWSPLRSRILIAGGVALTCILAFPPWYYWINTAANRRSQPAERSFILNPPVPQSPWSVGVDIGRLAAEILLVAATTGVGLVLRSRFARQPPSQSTN